MGGGGGHGEYLWPAAIGTFGFNIADVTKSLLNILPRICSWSLRYSRRHSLSLSLYGITGWCPTAGWVRGGGGGSERETDVWNGI